VVGPHLAPLRSCGGSNEATSFILEGVYELILFSMSVGQFQCNRHNPVGPLDRRCYRCRVMLNYFSHGESKEKPTTKETRGGPQGKEMVNSTTKTIIHHKCQLSSVRRGDFNVLS
jgi:hypothetical protein